MVTGIIISIAIMKMKNINIDSYKGKIHEE